MLTTSQLFSEADKQDNTTSNGNQVCHVANH